MEFLDREMMKRFMHSAPVNIFFKDTECRYCFASEICDLVSVGENGSIVGKTDLEVQKFPEMGKMYYEDDKKILATGEGSQYISEFPMENGESLYFEIKKSAVRDENGNIIGIVGIVDNVSSANIKAYIDLENYGVGEHEVEVKVKGDDLKLSYTSKTKKVKVRITEK